MAAVMIGVDPHKASHTTVAIGAAEEPLGELRVRACIAQTERLMAWAAAWPQRTWAVEGADGTGHRQADLAEGPGSRRLLPRHPVGHRRRGMAPAPGLHRRRAEHQLRSHRGDSRIRRRPRDGSAHGRRRRVPLGR
jgi:hypothetical protein